MDAITHNNLLLRIDNVDLAVLRLTINEEIGKHGILIADVATEPETKDYLLQEGDGSVAVYAGSGGSLYPLFLGILKKMRGKTVGRQSVIHLEAVTESYWMDISVHNRVFQDTAMTSHQFLEKLMEPYAQSQLLPHIPDVPMGEILVQYQETDWSFLNRILSGYASSACVSACVPGINLQAGLADAGCREVDWDFLPHSMHRNTAPQKEKLGQSEYCHYELDSYDLLTLGEKVRFLGQEFHIGKIKREIHHELLCSRYSLYLKEGLFVPRYYNPHLGGISINGIVTEVKRNKILGRLEDDALTEYREQYMFPFSTVAASPDGSGWYCMPKKGDRIRIFFPTDNENDGYAIANIAGESKPAGDGAMGNPDLKDITAPDGKSVRFVKGGIQLSVGKQKGTVTLTNDGKAEIKTEESIEIDAAEKISFGANTEMKVTAGTQIQITNVAGSGICMTAEVVELQAERIESN